MKISSLAAPKVVKMTTSRAVSDENFVKMTTFSFQCDDTKQLPETVLLDPKEQPSVKF